MSQARFLLAWCFPLLALLAALRSPWLAWAAMAAAQMVLALVERHPRWGHSPQPVQAPLTIHQVVLRGQVLLQTAWLLTALYLIQAGATPGEVMVLGLAAGATTGAQGITFAHELGHSRSRLDRILAWWLMASVTYAHFMVEHYRGHHPRAATDADPASARRGESLWQFLPRTVIGGWHSAWALEAAHLHRLHRSWLRSPLAWACAGQLAWLATLAVMLGVWALLFWLVQSAYAIYLLESINYIEHYGLRRQTRGERVEPFGVQHAWNADHTLTNCCIANLQRHSDHHLHAWKSFATLEALPGPQLPTGYAGCLFLAAVPPLWFRVMHPRLDAAGGDECLGQVGARPVS